MNRNQVKGLILLNVVLLVVLGMLSFAPPAVEAQGFGRGGDYIMIAGKVQGKTNKVIYITDMNNGAMLAVTYDLNRRSIVPLGARNLNTDYQAIQNREAGR